MRDKSRVLILEEEPVLAEITSFRLELLGYEVSVAESAADVLERVAQVPPDAILLGLSLTSADAIDLANRLSNDEKTHGIPIMVLSPDADLSKVQRAFAAGAREYLVTPFDPAVLESKLENLLASAPRK